MPVSAQCEMSPALSISDVHLKQTGSPSSCISTGSPDIQTHVFAYQESFKPPKKSRNLTILLKYVCGYALASSVAGSTTSCSLSTMKSATIEECLAKKDTDELSREKEKLFTRLAKRKLCTSKDRSILKCKTGGQPVVFYRVPVARK